MRILQVCPRYYPSYGGVEEHVKNISEGLAGEHEVVVCTTNPSGRLCSNEFINKVEVKRFKGFAPKESYYFSRDLRTFLKKHSRSFDVVHAHSYHALPALYAAEASVRNKFVFSPHYHGRGHTRFRNFLHMPYSFYGRRIFERADRVVCVSDYEKNLVLDRFDVSGKITVIPNGVRLEEFGMLKKNRHDYKILLFVGRIEEYKGVQYVVEALRELGDDVFLHIVGDGPFKKKLMGMAKSLNVSDRVKFFADLPRDELLRKYSEADVFVLLSRHEAFGISVAEALSSKTPCVVANTSALSEWIDGKNCFGIDYPIMIDRLRKLLSETIDNNIIVSGVALWTWRDVVAKLTDVYEELVYS